MDTSSRKAIAVTKLVVVLAVLVALIAFVGSGVAPQVPLSQLIVGSVAAVLALFIALIVAIASSASIRQFVLRAGGTDTQWLWFAQDPPGLKNIRGSGDNNK